MSSSSRSVARLVSASTRRVISISSHLHLHLYTYTYTYYYLHYNPPAASLTLTLHTIILHTYILHTAAPRLTHQRVNPNYLTRGSAHRINFRRTPESREKLTAEAAKLAMPGERASSGSDARST